MSETKEQYVNYCRNTVEEFKNYLSEKKGFIFEKDENLKVEDKIFYLNMNFIIRPHKGGVVKLHTFYGELSYFSTKVYFPILHLSNNNLEFIKQVGGYYLIYRIEYATQAIQKLKWLASFIDIYEADKESDGVYSDNPSCFLEKFICEVGSFVKKEQLENWRHFG
jgi:hypothetical protein